MSSFKWGIQAIESSGGERIPLEPSSLTVLIGPNNSGKSKTLEEIQARLTGNVNAKYLVVQNLQCFRAGELTDLRQWMNEHYLLRSIGGVEVWVALGVQASDWNISEFWGQGDVMPSMNPFLTRRLDAEARIVATKPWDTIDLYQQPPGAYIHALQADESLLERVSREVQAAFGVGLVINWGGGRQVWFHVGPEPARSREDDRVSEAYLRDVNKLPRLELEGDGIRSFVGTLLASECGAQLVLLIDEPEAFLHPPQARRLGAALARSAEMLQRQIVVATHSADIVQGALGASKRVSFCRITRAGSVNHMSLLDSGSLEKLLKKPQLRSAAALDGVFHEGVAVCEADADCRLYEALLRRMEDQRVVDGPVDLYFIHGGGKGELATLASAYRRLSVNVAVIADLDLLRNRAEFEKVVGILGGDFAVLEGRYNSTRSALANLGPRLSVADVAARLRELAAEVQGKSAVGADQRKALDELIRDSADWSQAKQHGVRKLKGGARRDCETLLNECAAIGLFLVPFGELESWWGGGPADKNEWFVAALERLSTDENSFEKAALFMAGVCAFFGRGTTLDTSKLLLE